MGWKLDFSLFSLLMLGFFSSVAVHIEVVALLVVAFVGAYIQILHRINRRRLNLLHEPGTIASAVSIGAQTNLANLLDGHQQQDDFIRTLQNKKFRIDPRTMKIVMQGEDGYEQAASPHPRQTVFGELSGNLNRRFSSVAPSPGRTRGIPTSP
jgi:hypothetical protein